MKLLHKNLKLHQLILVVTANLLLVSCGTYQSAYNNDGIYSDQNTRETERKVIVVNEEEYNDYEENYFTKKLGVLESIDDNEVFTDVDSYNSGTTYTDDEVIDEALNYSANQPWGYDNNVIVNINLMNDPYWGGGFNNWAFQNNGWGYNNWGFRNWGMWGNPFWGNNPYWHPYHRGMAWNNGYSYAFLPNFGINGFRNNRYNNGSYRYGRRTTNKNITTRNSRTNSRYNISRRSNSRVNRNASNTIRRNNTSTRSTRVTKPTRRSSTTIKRRSSNSRNNSSTRRSSSNRNNNSRSSSSSSGRSSRSSSTRSSRSKSSGSRKRSTSSKKRGN